MAPPTAKLEGIVMSKLLRTGLLAAALFVGLGLVNESRAYKTEVIYCSFYCISPTRPPISVPASSYEECAEKCREYCGIDCPFLGEE